jgi:phenylacetate-CoA ligase
VARRLEESLRAAFALRMPVVVMPQNSLPRFEMKAKRWVKM